METVLEECANEKQHSVVRFLWAEELTAKDTHKEMFPVMVGSVCRLKLFTTGWQTFS
jgi:hypothetical protein